MSVGSGKDDCDVGPLINAAGFEKVERHVRDALSKGARARVGGTPHERGGNFYAPTVLCDVTSKMTLAHDEVFGPVAPLFSFDTEEEAIAIANDTPFGLASYLYTEDLSRAFRVSEAIESGIVGVNAGIVSNAVAPFGGVKESGLGREGSRHGLDEFMEIKYVHYKIKPRK